MNSNMMAVIKKEFTRFFTDKRMVLTTLIMPGLMIYLLYSVMGQGLSSQFAGGDEKPKAQVVSLPASMGSMGQDAPLEFTGISGQQEKDAAMDALAEGSGDYQLLVCFPENFDEEALASGTPY